jgi:hypothetical protein
MTATENIFVTKEAMGIGSNAGAVSTSLPCWYGRGYQFAEHAERTGKSQKVTIENAPK